MGNDAAGDDWDEEESGARLMEQVLGGVARRRDRSGGECKHDCDRVALGPQRLAQPRYGHADMRSTWGER